MRKVVLISETGYNREHDSLLSSFLDQKYELFCAVGKDCELWEEVMDELAVGNGEARDTLQLQVIQMNQLMR